ncbi:Molybdopterin biosynthesis MoaE [Gilbertella persicaria]|uniref:Molybdopterin biosynthesis MoaE n=1 Tax=Gilbertella persicaria TaxID=101096 RepID=UPI00221FCAD4|nr:Molybdopterin biosynthesis MoaE [Gilbertella persicaria]KAI8078048.1 Molybdopterin biosynthesis MoaE [Gilbertella persicaria]
MSLKDIIEISSEPLPTLDYITGLVQDDTAGAITTFSGTTRNTFEDKTVVELEYEAYIPMAKKVLMELIKEARSKWDLKHVSIYHRTGVVPVGKVSVVVATSSKHRADSMDSARYLIDELKDRCPIWKREVYQDGSVWKGSCTGCQKKH